MKPYCKLLQNDFLLNLDLPWQLLCSLPFHHAKVSSELFSLDQVSNIDNITCIKNVSELMQKIFK